MKGVHPCLMAVYCVSRRLSKVNQSTKPYRELSRERHFLYWLRLLCEWLLSFTQKRVKRAEWAFGQRLWSRATEAMLYAVHDGCRCRIHRYVGSDGAEDDTEADACASLLMDSVAVRSVVVRRDPKHGARHERLLPYDIGLWRRLRVGLLQREDAREADGQYEEAAVACHVRRNAGRNRYAGSFVLVWWSRAEKAARNQPKKMTRPS